MKALKNKKEAFENWCLYNIYGLSTEKFTIMYGINPHKFRQKYWSEGLQNHWIKFHENRVNKINKETP